MKKFFARDRARTTKGSPRPDAPGQAIQQDGPPRASTDDLWEVVNGHHPVHSASPAPASLTSSNASLLPGASPPLPAVANQRPASPYGGESPRIPNAARPLLASRDRERDRAKRTAPTGGSTAAPNILRALDPHMAIPPSDNISEGGDSIITGSDLLPPRDQQKEKRNFWERGTGREKDKERDREGREDDAGMSMYRAIGYTVSKAQDNWAFILQICERASYNESNAKEAARALRHEFKHGVKDPHLQLSAARLLTIMIRNCSEIFYAQINSRKFLEALEDVLASQRTSPVVKERIRDVIADAAYSGTSSDRDPDERNGFLWLWKRVKPPGAPDNGVPFDAEDPMFTPPAANRNSQFMQMSLIDALQTPLDSWSSNPQTISAPPAPNIARHESSLTDKDIVPPQEDIKRLFQECKVGSGNASLLMSNLAFVRPEDLMSKEIIREFYAKCRQSQEFIYAQIPWASSCAEKSRQSSGQERTRQRRNLRAESEEHLTLTQEEQLLAALLGANEELLEALRVYDDLKRIAQPEDFTHQETPSHTNTSPTRRPYSRTGRNSPSIRRSPSYSPLRTSYDSNASTIERSSIHHAHLPSSLTPGAHNGNANLLLPSHNTVSQLTPHPPLLSQWPPGPLGPRSPARQSLSSRTPSPDSDHRRPHSRNGSDFSFQDQISAGMDRLHIRQHQQQHQQQHQRVSSPSDTVEIETPVNPKPSAKALGKRRANLDDGSSVRDVRESSPEHAENIFHRDDSYQDSDIDSDEEARRRPWAHQAQTYVYDAWMERQKMREMGGPQSARLTVMRDRSSLLTKGLVH